MTNQILAFAHPMRIGMDTYVLYAAMVKFGILKLWPVTVLLIITGMTTPAYSVLKGKYGILKEGAVAVLITSIGMGSPV
jgi:hypothetical protein